VHEPAGLHPEHRDQARAAPVLDRLRDDVEDRRPRNDQERNRRAGEERQRAGLGHGQLVSLSGMVPRVCVASTKPECALVRSQG
jgi:hypothetical protein